MDIERVHQEVDAMLKAREMDRANRLRVKIHHGELTALRKLLGCDQAHFAKLAGTNKLYIVLVESGQTRRISAEALQRILQVYETVKQSTNAQVTE